jgi:hypothetical protein
MQAENGPLEAWHEELPTCIYSYESETNKLWWTNLVTGKPSCHQVPSFQFKHGCIWSELPRGNLIITGGGVLGVACGEVERIDTLREYAVTHDLPMLSPRLWHCAVNHYHLYVVGGYNSGRCLAQCERYVCSERRWEALPPLPIACYGPSGVVHEGSLYALGGYNDGAPDSIQKLSLDRLTWEVIELRLPHIAKHNACFLHDNQVYFVLESTLYRLQPLQAVKTLTADMWSFFGPSYYSRGTLYCSYHTAAARSWEIGSLDS